MWDVLFWVLVVFLIVVAFGTVAYGRVSSDGHIRRWSDIHVTGVVYVLSAALILRSDMVESLLLANLLLCAASALAIEWAIVLVAYIKSDLEKHLMR